MKIATSSASFSEALKATLTQLEWLDICANELEVDGVVFDARHFPRHDADYIAQLKKSAVDLGLTVAALETSDHLAAERLLADAVALGAPLLLLRAPGLSSSPDAWGQFAAIMRSTAASAKRLNVTLALRTAVGTLCESADDCKRLAKDVDSAWLRFAAAPGGHGNGASLLAKSVIATHRIDDITNFALPGDVEAADLIASMARFRGFLVLEYGLQWVDSPAYHHAMERFASLRARALTQA